LSISVDVGDDAAVAEVVVDRRRKTELAVGPDEGDVLDDLRPVLARFEAGVVVRPIAVVLITPKFGNSLCSSSGLMKIFSRNS
jgi:hypothetical protein